MALFTVLDYVTKQLDGLVSPNLAPAVAYLNPPASGDGEVGQLQLFVWSSGLGEARQTAPRMTGGLASTAGFKKLSHEVAIYALVVDDPTEATAGTAFFQALDAIMARLRAIDIPVELQDPEGGPLTHLVLIGEAFKVRTDAVRSTAAKRYVRYLAQVTTEAVETLQS